MVQIYHFYNRKHYGDNLLNLKFLYNLSSILQKQGIKVFYYYNAEYNKNTRELERYVNKETVTLKRLGQRPEGSIELHMGNRIGDLSHVRNFDKYYDEFYKRIVSLMNIQIAVPTSLYQPEPYLQTLYERMDPKFQNLDILILNSEPQSDQFTYNKRAMEAMCVFLHTKFKVATTTPVDDTIPCTWTEGLTIQDIGAISTHATYIVAVQSGPLVGCYNSTTKEYVKQWFILADAIRYSQIPVHNNVTLETILVFFQKLSESSCETPHPSPECTQTSNPKEMEKNDS